MKKRRILLLTVVFVVCMCTWAGAVNYIWWTAPDGSYALRFTEGTDGTLALSGHTPYATDGVNVEIPAEVEGKPVTAINASAMQRSGYTGTLTIPGSVVSIGANAFYSCKFTGELVIPEGVVEIGAYAFYSCSGFSGELVLPSTLTRVNGYAFSFCSGLTGEFVLPAGVNFVGSALSGCGFTSVVLPGSVATVAPGLFGNCKNLSSVTMGEGIEVIGERAFSNCSALTKNPEFPSTLKTIGESAFYNCTGMKELTLPEGLEKIEAGAFEGCKAIAGEVKIPGSVTEVGKAAFSGCTSLGIITLNEGVERIGEKAFYNCSNATALTLPSTLKSIGVSAFESCRNISSELKLPAGLTQLGDYAFRYCNKLTGTAEITSSMLGGLGTYVFLSCAITGYELPDEMTTVPDGLFQACGSITGELKLPAGLTKIGTAAFSSCAGLTGTPKLPEGLVEIGNNAFYMCTGLTGPLKLPAGLTKLNTSAFAYCSGITSVEFPDGLQRIEAEALRGMTSLTGRMSWPKGLTYLGDNALRDCHGLVFDGGFPDTLTYIGDYNFYKKSYDAEDRITGRLHLPVALTEIGDYAFTQNYSLQGSIEWPKGLVKVGQWAFYQCTGLTGDLIIPPGTRSIGQHAFTGCNGLSGTLKIPYGVTFPMYPNGPFPEKVFSTVWIPGDVNYSGFSDAFRAGDYQAGTTTYYYGESKDHLKNNLGYSLLDEYLEAVRFESYPARELILQAENSTGCEVGRGFTLSAYYYNSTAVEDLTFTWESDDAMVTLSEAQDHVAANGYSAEPSVKVLPLKAGETTITVSGPDGLTDTIRLTIIDYKKLTFLPSANQPAEGPIPVPPGVSVPLTFRYDTSGVAAEEWPEITWEIIPGEEGTPSGVRLGTVFAVGVDASTVKLTANVTGETVGEPVTVKLTGPGGCTASVQVLVPEERICLLDEDQNVPEEDERAIYMIGTGDRFTVYLRYENPADEAEAQERLENLTWTQSKFDFMVHPDDMKEDVDDPVRRYSTTAYPLEVKWEQTEPGVYLVRAEFAAAQEGTCGLQAKTGDYASDAALIYSAFDEERYLADLLHRTNVPAADDTYQMLRADTPATVMLEYLHQNGGYQTAHAAWAATKTVFDALEDPSNLYDLTVKEEDLYFGILLEMLNGILDKNMVDSIAGVVEFGDNVVDGLEDAYRMVYGQTVDMSTIDPFDVFKNSARREKLAEAFEAKHTRLKKAGDWADVTEGLMSIAKGVDALGDRMAAYSILQEVSDSMLTVLEEMEKAAAAYENSEALVKAIGRCIEQVELSSEEACEAVLIGSAVANGTRGVAKLLEKQLWEPMMKRIKVSYPVAAMVYTAYYSGTTLSNLLGNTDATLEEYYKLVALQSVKQVVWNVHDGLNEEWESDPAAYLAAVNALFNLQLMDCDHALDYVDAADDALLSWAIEALGGTGFDRAEDAFAAYRAKIETLYDAYRILWVDYVLDDYPGVLLEETYAAVYSKILGVKREVVFACPVEVFVMDGEDVVAYVTEDDAASDVGDVSVAQIGEEKHVLFLDGVDYAIRVLGTGTGSMNVTDISYSNAQMPRKLEYHDLPVTPQSEYTSGTFNHLLEHTASVEPHVDSAEPATRNLTVISGRADETLLRPGQRVTVAAVVPDGYTFAGWQCSSGNAVLEEPDNPVSTLRMPDEDVVLIAQLRAVTVPDNRLTLTGETGLILRELPESLFTVQTVWDGACIVSTYNSHGQLLNAYMPTSADGIVRTQLDNRDGQIARVALFRLEGGAGCRPLNAMLEYTATK